MTRNQEQCLAFLKAYQRRHGQPPTYREISLALGVTSKGSVTRIVNHLLKEGVITRRIGKPRGLRVLFNGRSASA